MESNSNWHSCPKILSQSRGSSAWWIFGKGNFRKAGCSQDGQLLEGMGRKIWLFCYFWWCTDLLWRAGLQYFKSDVRSKLASMVQYRLTWKLWHYRQAPGALFCGPGRWTIKEIHFSLWTSSATCMLYSECGWWPGKWWWYHGFVGSWSQDIQIRFGGWHQLFQSTWRRRKIKRWRHFQWINVFPENRRPCSRCYKKWWYNQKGG